MLAFDTTEILIERVSTNFELHGDDHVVVLDVAVAAIFQPPTMAPLLGQYCDRVLFNRRADGVLEPSDPYKHTDMPLDFEDDLLAKGVRFTLSGDVAHDFEECPLSKIRYEPILGGGIETKFSVRIRPSGKDEAWAFLEHHARHVKLAITESAIALKKNVKQQELPLQGGGAGKSTDDESTNGSHAPAGQAAGNDEAAARAQAEAFERGKPVGVPTAETH